MALTEKIQKGRLVGNGEEEPGESNELLTRSPPQVEDVMNLVVFLRDRTAVRFTLEDAPQTQCSSLLHLVIHEQGLPPEASDVFSLWLVSPIIELRLKKHHNPFEVVQKWDELCARYTDASNEEIHENEPVLMVQRDVFYRKEQEQYIQNEQILCLLYHEAKYNVIEGRYILYEEDYHYLAGIQALIHLGSYDPSQHVLADYRANLVKFYPEHMYAHSRFSFLNRNNGTSPPCENSFMDAHRRASEELQHIASRDTVAQLYRKYLELLWSYPFYGQSVTKGALPHIDLPDSIQLKVTLHCISLARQPSLTSSEKAVRSNPNQREVTLAELKEAGNEWLGTASGRAGKRGAFFNGVVEAKMSKLRRFILPNPDMRVMVCINTEGVSVINKQKNEFLLYVPYSQLSWIYQDLEWDGDNDPPPTLMLQFICDEQHEESNGQPITKLLHIYSREAKLMDALIETCVNRKLEFQQKNTDFVDGGVIEAKKILSRLEKLSLETYTQDGEQLETA